MPRLHLYHDETPPDTDATCPVHGCAIYPLRPIQCPECEKELEELANEYGTER
ncbi:MULTISPECIES: hypothetical protein [unclassified Bifidobacterium]|uniref:hypothetical protein n=1 Tax=unclassified Bifidobacterium TaxID=2608897 RepID=UPI0015E2BFB7|nr:MULTISPECIES: hypothetical protein [unclassified Bifidobacterium]